jgi:hypothetical protein
MTPEQAKTALQFLVRVDIKGGEAPAWMDVARALEAIMRVPIAVPVAEPEAVQK